MNKNDIIKNYAKAQELGCDLRCPRCGKFTMNKHTDNNALSRIADIYICNKCGEEESTENKPIESWYILAEPNTIDSRRRYTAPIGDRKNEYFEIVLSDDIEYPSIDIEIRKKKEVPKDDRRSNARVVIEWPESNEQPRVLVWASKKNEDYTDEIEFNNG